MKTKQQKQQISTLKKSSALILLYPNQLKHADSFKTLLLKRKSQMSFGNSYALPGGTCDPQDILMSKTNEFSTYSKITALRQFLQQTGILIYPSSAKQKVLALSFKSIPEVTKQIGDIWIGNLGLLQPAFRAITPQAIKGKRFDCLFHLCVVSQFVKIINVSLIVKIANQTKRSPQNLLNQQQQNQYTNLNSTTIIFNINESDDFIFQTPLNIIQRYNKKSIFLFPAQLILIMSLANLCNLNMRDELMKYSKHSDKNQFNVIQPIMFQIEMKNPTMLFMFGDHRYNHEQLLNKEVQSSSKQDIKNYFYQKIAKNFKIPNGQRVIYIGKQTYIVSNYQHDDSKCFLKYLPSRNRPILSSTEIKPKM